MMMISVPPPRGRQPARIGPALLGLLASAVLAGCVTDGMSSTQLGQGGSMATGSSNAAGASENKASALPSCPRPLGTLALVEVDQPGLAQYGLQSPVPLLRLMVQQSGCFQVVDRGQATTALMRERELANAGQLRAGANFGGGQLVAADFSMTPNVVFSSPDSGGGGLNLGAFIPGLAGSIAGSVSPSMTTKTAQTMLSLTDNRSGVQLGAAEGSARTSDFSLAGSVSLLRTGSYDAGASAYGNTPEGRVVTAAFIDAYGKLVQAVQPVIPPPQAAGPSPQAVAPVAAPAAKPKPKTKP